MSTRQERRDEMAQDNLETAHGADHRIPACPRCLREMTSYIVPGPKVCTRCHDELYGVGHRPMASRREDGLWVPACLKPGCTVVRDTPLLPHTEAATATDEARSWHVAAIHGPADGDLPARVRAS